MTPWSLIKLEKLLPPFPYLRCIFRQPRSPDRMWQSWRCPIFILFCSHLPVESFQEKKLQIPEIWRKNINSNKMKKNWTSIDSYFSDHFFFFARKNKQIFAILIKENCTVDFKHVETRSKKNRAHGEQRIRGKSRKQVRNEWLVSQIEFEGVFSGWNWTHIFSFSCGVPPILT